MDNVPEPGVSCSYGTRLTMWINIVSSHNGINLLCDRQNKGCILSCLFSWRITNFQKLAFKREN